MFKRWVKMSALVTIFVLATPIGLLAQAISPPLGTQNSSTWQPPVRIATEGMAMSTTGNRESLLQVQYLEPSDAVAIIEGGRLSNSSSSPEVPSESHAPILSWPSQASMAVESPPSLHPHQIIRAPRMIEQPGSHQHRSGHGGLHPVTPSTIHPLPPLLDHHATRVPPAVIPDASHREVWKSPYSYGFFGASGSRQWTRHFGYRDRDKEWRLR